MSHEALGCQVSHFENIIPGFIKIVTLTNNLGLQQSVRIITSSVDSHQATRRRNHLAVQKSIANRNEEQELQLMEVKTDEQLPDTDERTQNQQSQNEAILS